MSKLSVAGTKLSCGTASTQRCKQQLTLFERSTSHVCECEGSPSTTTPQDPPPTTKGHGANYMLEIFILWYVYTIVVRQLTTYHPSCSLKTPNQPPKPFPTLLKQKKSIRRVPQPVMVCAMHTHQANTTNRVLNLHCRLRSSGAAELFHRSWDVHTGPRSVLAACQLRRRPQKTAWARRGRSCSAGPD